MRALWLVNPATVAPVAAAIPATIYLSFGKGPEWLLPMFGLSFIVALGGIIVWLPIAGPILHLLPGRRRSLLVLIVGILVTAVVFGGVGAFLVGVFPKVAPEVPLWLGSFRMVLPGAYFGLIATLCLYIDPAFRTSPGP